MTQRVSRARELLLWLTAGLLTATLAFVITSFTVWDGVQGTAETVRDRTAPAILSTIGAKVELLTANAAAVQSFGSGDVVRSGPGRDYQDQIALASQNLAQSAGLNEAGDKATSELQVIEALLTQYSGEIEQADARYRQPGESTLGLADLWVASRMVDDQREGVRVLLDGLVSDQEQALAQQVAPAWANPVLWLVPAGVLLVLLVWTQWTFSRRFRRIFNPQLIAATALLATAIGIGVWWTAGVNAHLRETRVAVQTVVDSRNDQASQADAARVAKLRQFLDDRCGPGRCGTAVADLAPGPATVPTALTDHDVSAQTEDVGLATEGASSGGWLRWVLPGTGIVIGVLTGWGLWRRLDEYRYQA
ncbi:hypothetical protein [Amycolatopsis pigmentata]|uniref:Integral membrane protein n=1 Tax=Amycolatopsis pigmentata TaxID=450801 RepID=A0ABW5FXJ2_9PSEU